MKYNESIVSLLNSLSKHFDNIYHSVELITVDDTRFPAASTGDEWIPVGPTDQHETIYVRRSGDDIVLEEKKLGSCSVSYAMQTPLRIVFFRDRASFAQDEILSKLMKASLIPFTRLRSITRDKFKLIREETNVPYNIGASTVYLAIDINVIWHLISDNCGEDFCVVMDNPVKQCS